MLIPQAIPRNLQRFKFLILNFQVYDWQFVSLQKELQTRFSRHDSFSLTFTFLISNVLANLSLGSQYFMLIIKLYPYAFINHFHTLIITLAQALAQKYDCNIKYVFV